MGALDSLRSAVDENTQALEDAKNRILDDVSQLQSEIEAIKADPEDLDTDALEGIIDSIRSNTDQLNSLDPVKVDEAEESLPTAGAESGTAPAAQPSSSGDLGAGQPNAGDGGGAAENAIGYSSDAADHATNNDNPESYNIPDAPVPVVPDNGESTPNDEAAGQTVADSSVFPSGDTTSSTGDNAPVTNTSTEGEQGTQSTDAPPVTDDDAYPDSDDDTNNQGENPGL